MTLDLLWVACGVFLGTMTACVYFATKLLIKIVSKLEVWQEDYVKTSCNIEYIRKILMIKGTQFQIPDPTPIIKKAQRAPATAERKAKQSAARKKWWDEKKARQNTTFDALATPHIKPKV